MLVKIHSETPSERRVREIAEILERGGVIAYPTDTVYALACAVDQKGAFEQICKLKQVQPRKARFSLIFEDLAHVARYTAQIDTPVYRLLKKHLPGPFTFVLEAGHSIPSFMRSSHKTVGIRIPDHRVSMAIVRALGKPLVNTSLKSDDSILEYHNDPDEIHKRFGNQIDVVVDSGPGAYHPSTVVDLTGDMPEILRQGRGELII
jgi:tRNA threonylcarbamoyl adenosine modification protein (Sua5/YciO/YrdC/YwlC family)